ncbi:hypothetical protein NCCP2716_01050 [Sporosarcina sp. NCCP-2716]|nr:hypothetical protein NCCP2716_01050 [Sporosarcina sp. NCCP-2716]
MSRQYDEEMAKDAQQRWAISNKGYKACVYCNEMFRPRHEDNVCNDC